MGSMKYPHILVLLLFIFLLTDCVSDSPLSPVENGIETGIVTDIDNNEYQTVKIGEQWWMAENLRVTRYRNGDKIFTGLDNWLWGNIIAGGYSVYPHSEVEDVDSYEEIIEAYGALYNWYATTDERGLCPEGWRVPDDSDWKQLEMYLGISQQAVEKTGWREFNEAGKIKSPRTALDLHPKWNIPNIEATNETGWSGLPGGYRNYHGEFTNIGIFGRWWSSSEHLPGGDYALFRSLGSSYSTISRFVALKQHGFSIRCVSE
jgi:uncharacterized protein (TIGR02145 family)